MNWTHIRRIAWKDMRRIGGLWAAFVIFWALCVLYVVISSLIRPGITLPWTMQEVFLFILSTAVVYAVGWAGITFASEHDDNTYLYLRSLAVTGKSVFYGKLYFGAASTIALIIALTALCGLCGLLLDYRGGQFATTGMAEYAVSGMISTAFAIPFAIAVGMFWSMRINRPLVALMLAGVSVGVVPGIGYIVGVVLMGQHATGRESMLAIASIASAVITLFTIVLLAVARYRSRHWLPIDPPEFDYALNAYATPSTLPAQREQAPTSVMPQQLFGFSRLLWLFRRQSITQCIAVGVCALVVACGLVLGLPNLFLVSSRSYAVYLGSSFSIRNSSSIAFGCLPS